MKHKQSLTFSRQVHFYVTGQQLHGWTALLLNGMGEGKGAWVTTA